MFLARNRFACDDQEITSDLLPAIFFSLSTTSLFNFSSVAGDTDHNPLFAIT
jgi:predicted permease